MYLVVSNIRKEFTMATKLKNLRMTSVDLVRNGANQEADICLFKSADPTETPTMPTTEEKNIFKRFIDWLRQNPTEEPTAPIEKADEEPYLVDLYKSAITESLQSIAADETLSETEKNDMIAKSLDEYHEAMLGLFGFEPEDEPLQKGDDMSYLFEDLEKSEYEEVEKFNPNHDSRGRFASAGGGGSVAGNAGKKKTLADLENDYYKASEEERKFADRYDDMQEKWANRKITDREWDKYNSDWNKAIDAKEAAREKWYNGEGVEKSADIDDIEEV